MHCLFMYDTSFTSLSLVARLLSVSNDDGDDRDLCPYAEMYQTLGPFWRAVVDISCGRFVYTMGRFGLGHDKSEQMNVKAFRQSFF